MSRSTSSSSSPVLAPDITPPLPLLPPLPPLPLPLRLSGSKSPVGERRASLRRNSLATLSLSRSCSSSVSAFRGRNQFIGGCTSSLSSSSSSSSSSTTSRSACASGDSLPNKAPPLAERPAACSAVNSGDRTTSPSSVTPPTRLPPLRTLTLPLPVLLPVLLPLSSSSSRTTSSTSFIKK